MTFSTLDLKKYEHYTKGPNTHFASFKLMKFALFGWFDKRLIQTDEDQDIIRQKLIDSKFDLKNLLAFVSVFVPFIIWLFLEFHAGLAFGKSLRFIE